MRNLLFSLWLCSCASVSAANAPRASAPAPVLSAQPAEALEMTRTPCPLKTPRAAPSCFAPPEPSLARGPVRAAQRLTCPVLQLPGFVGGGEPALSLQLQVMEGGKSLFLPFARTVTGALRVFPEELQGAFLQGDAPVGLTWGGTGKVFWKDSVCEAPPEGELSELAPLGADEVVAMWLTRDGVRRLVHRDAAGAWRVLGAAPLGTTPRLAAAGGRVAAHYEESGLVTEYGLLFPELRRTEVVHRADGPLPWMPYPAVSPLEARPGSRLATALFVEHPAGTGPLTLARPDGAAYRRVLVAQLESLPGCKRDTPGRFRFRSFSMPAVVALDARAALVAVLEHDGECEGRVIPPAPVNCAPGQPCREPPPGWEMKELRHDRTLVLWSVGAASREVARVRLPPVTDRMVNSVSLAVWGERLYAMAGGWWLELDRGALGGAR